MLVLLFQVVYLCPQRLTLATFQLLKDYVFAEAVVEAGTAVVVAAVGGLPHPTVRDH